MNLLVLVGVSLLLLALGIIVGWYYAPDRRPLRRAAEEGRSYARGLVEFVEGNQDAAIQEITTTLKKNTRSVEAYFALGALFRNRGELERAVRVHQAILVRRDVDKKTRLRAHHQLALDFREAGFRRRAIGALERVITQDKKNAQALRELAELYQEDGQWERAAGAYRRVGKLTGEDTTRLQAHMLVERAAVGVRDGDLKGARKLLRRALSSRPDSIHALHELARYHEARGNLDAAAKVWERALRQAPDLAAFFAPRLEHALFERDKLDRFDRLLRDLVQEHPGNVHLKLALARFDAKRSPERALAELSEILDEAPTLVPARREAARLVLESGDPEAIRRAFEELVELLARADRGYRCDACGHTDEELFWRCPACGAWDSVRVAWGRRKGETPA